MRSQEAEPKGIKKLWHAVIHRTDGPIKSFADLAGEAKPSNKDLIRTYFEYANSGAAINADVVIGVMKRTSFSLAGIDAIFKCSLIGAIAHHEIKEDTKHEGQENELSELREMEEYIKVADFALDINRNHRLSFREFLGLLNR